MIKTIITTTVITAIICYLTIANQNQQVKALDDLEKEFTTVSLYGCD